MSVLLLISLGHSPLGFGKLGTGGQNSVRLLRERDNLQARFPARHLNSTLSLEGMKVLTQITQAAEGNNWLKVRELYDSYSGEEVQILNAVMYAAARCGQLRQGAEVYKRLCNLNITKTEPSYSAALKIHAKLGHRDIVRQIWKEARQSLDLSQQLAIARIDAAATEGDVETSALILDEMNKSGVDIQIFHITSAIRACWAAKGQRWRAAEFLFQMAAGLGLQPTLPTFACLAGAYRSAPLQGKMV